jgi:two-component system chemotaxis response regulator CheB
MARIRVLVVDDSVVIRKVVAEVLSADPEVEVGTAATGSIALAKLTQSPPDVVILDVEMPDMDGLQTLAAIRKTHPRLPVVMFSAITEKGAAATLDALALGATDYFTKPGGPGGLDESRRVLREELLPAIKQLCPPAKTSPVTPLAVAPLVWPRPVAAPVTAVVIAASTGGPNALMELFQALPATLHVPLFVVQHMPPMFTRMLAERLTAGGRVPVEEAANGVVAVRGRAYLAPGDFHMTLARDGATVRVLTNKDALENSCRPAADPLFRSAAKVYGSGTLAVVLTGMGSDGLRGCQAVRAAGGQIVAQDEATSVVWGMPGAVARAALAERLLPLPLIGPEIVRRVTGGGGA